MHFGQLPVDGAISDADILALRRQVWADGTINAGQAEAILTLNEDVARPSPAWTTFFVEAITEFLLNTSEPRGHVSDTQSDWLILRLDHLDSPATLELLVHLLEKMDSTPDAMKAYVLARIERGVAGTVTAEACLLLRRVIFAPAGFAPARVSAEEAEMLFRIKDATLHADNAPEWQTLFVQGVANYLQGWQGLAMPTREQEAAHQQFLTGRTPGFLGNVVRTSPNGLVSAARAGGFGRRAPRDIVAEERADFAISPEERRWLESHLHTDGAIDPLETALLVFLGQ
jgi:hypothetical protein